MHRLPIEAQDVVRVRLKSGQVVLPRMRALVAAMDGYQGVRRARRVLDAVNGRSESAGETRTRLVIAEMSVEQPELQVDLRAGGETYRPDFVWRRFKLIVEFDGDGKYFDYAPTADVLLRERRRENALIEAGWRFIRFTWDDLSDPAGMKRRIENALRVAQAA
ncbi:endonuclease domain-containing protein [Specibacter cremeus]|uniref:endonuclease domain-containing protein n=1 Tax=Specibacter cremeus TaxID=1629051 RepID=UPI000F7B4605|nr:DUF559 domain-containing protein [Specibacter cremeus]